MLSRGVTAALCACALAAGCATRGAHGDGAAPLSIAAAASLADVFEELGATFTRATGRPVVVSRGSSGTLAAQIEQGAPFDLFASAAERYVDEVIRAGAAVADTKTTYALGRLVVWTGPGEPSVRALRDLAEPGVRAIAVANPDHAPYGRAARQALDRAGLWDRVAARVVYGSHVAQALQFARSGNADVSLTALTLVIDRPGSYVIVAPSLYDPLRQTLVLTQRARRRDDARAFLELIASAPGRAILRRYGLVPAGPPPPAP